MSTTVAYLYKHFILHSGCDVITKAPRETILYLYTTVRFYLFMNDNIHK